MWEKQRNGIRYSFVTLEQKLTTSICHRVPDLSLVVTSLCCGAGYRICTWLSVVKIIVLKILNCYFEVSFFIFWKLVQLNTIETEKIEKVLLRDRESISTRCPVQGGYPYPGIPPPPPRQELRQDHGYTPTLKGPMTRDQGRGLGPEVPPPNTFIRHL